MMKLFLPLSLLALVGAANAATVQFDFNTSGSPTLAGWTAAPLGNGTDGTVSLATTAIGAVTVDSRDRGAANGGGAEAGMWQDFVFANGSFNTAAGSGLSLALVGLSPSTTYPITIWAFDDSSAPQPADTPRAGGWSGGGGSGRLTFPDSPDPSSLSDYNITFNATSDPAGELTISGIVSATNPSTSHNVFINGLEVGNAIPEPSSALLGLIGLGGLLLRRRR